MFARFRWGVLCCSLFGTHDFGFFWELLVQRVCVLGDWDGMMNCFFGLGGRSYERCVIACCCQEMSRVMSCERQNVLSISRRIYWLSEIHYSSCLLSCIACELVRVACCQLTGELKVYWSGVRCWMCFSWESVFNGIVMIARYFGVYE